MPLLGKKERDQIKKIFDENLVNEVTLMMFTQTIECQYCNETRMIVEELAELSPKVKAEVYNFTLDKEVVEKYGIDKIPAIAILGREKRDLGIRFYGIPSGYEFTTLIEDIVDISKEETKLTEPTWKALAELDVPLHIQVFVTPTCPYCPRMVRLAHQFAMATPKIRSDMIEVIEFPYLGEKYQVMGVPKTVINDLVEFEGVVPEEYFLERVQKAAQLLKEKGS
jgi:glutaredoxin-like protein